MSTLIDQQLLTTVSDAARLAPRRRKNRNFHPADDYPGHRLLNGIEPDSYVMPHCHFVPHKVETILCPAWTLGRCPFLPFRHGRPQHCAGAGRRCAWHRYPAWRFPYGAGPG